MENIKFILVSIITLALVALIGYWAFGALQSGTEYKQTQEIKKLKQEKEELNEKVESLTEELAVFQSKYPEPTTDTEENPDTEAKEPKPEPDPKVVYKNQTLINELQELIDDNIHMKLKSVGTRVGTVQKFLNIYNKTSNRIDNDYGNSTKTAVASFQKKEGLTADGEAGPSTFKKMIEWLKKQG
jgi:murein L,D-transpeptidase YcbB/YkuD